MKDKEIIDYVVKQFINFRVQDDYYHPEFDSATECFDAFKHWIASGLLGCNMPTYEMNRYRYVLQCIDKLHIKRDIYSELGYTFYKK